MSRIWRWRAPMRRRSRAQRTPYSRSRPARVAYLSESDFFDANWKKRYWGPNFDRLAAIKKRYDPEGLFFTHHGVGSDEWSADGFTRRRT